MKLDMHVHTVDGGRGAHRGGSTAFMTPEEIYCLAKARGMDLVTITDHDTIEGVECLASRPDVILGTEVTTAFSDGVDVHLGLLGFTQAQHSTIYARRGDMWSLLHYLRNERIFTTLNHVGRRANGRMTASHVAAVLPWIDAVEVVNGSCLPSQNETAARLADACWKVGVAGSGASTSRGIGRTWVEAPHARTREEFLNELRAGRIRVGGAHGRYLTIVGDAVELSVRGGVIGLARAPMRLIATGLRLVRDVRFARALLVDLARRPETRVASAAS